MKYLFTILLVLMASSQAFSQKKGKADPKDAIIDSLTKANEALVLKSDSTSTELVKYLEVYNVVKEKVIHYNFDPTRMSYLIDSLKSARDSAFAMLTTGTQPIAQSDSIKRLKNEIMVLRAALDSTSTIVTVKVESLTSDEIEKAKAINNLKQLKELLDAKIMTDAEFIAAKKKYLEKL
jgi:hypothetical protein